MGDIERQWEKQSDRDRVKVKRTERERKSEREKARESIYFISFDLLSSCRHRIHHQKDNNLDSNQKVLYI